MLKKAFEPALVVLFIVFFMFFGQCADAASVDHSTFDRLLKKHVVDGMVNYEAFKEDLGDLENYIEQLSATTQKEYKKWKSKEKIAFWLNAYNAHTIHIVLKNYPIKRKSFKGLAFPEDSIWQIPGIWGKVKLPLLGKDRSLNDIEHEILRKDFTEPRIHMALVCASVGCPPLRNEAYVGETLNEQLENQSRQFVNLKQNYYIDSKEKKIYISSIFKWFGEDFEGYRDQIVLPQDFDTEEAGIRAFIARYLPLERQAEVQQADWDTKFIKYDWSLNDKKA